MVAVGKEQGTLAELPVFCVTQAEGTLQMALIFSCLQAPQADANILLSHQLAASLANKLSLLPWETQHNAHRVQTPSFSSGLQAASLFPLHENMACTAQTQEHKAAEDCCLAPCM